MWIKKGSEGGGRTGQAAEGELQHKWLAVVGKMSDNEK